MFWTIVWAVVFAIYGIPALLWILKWLFWTKWWRITIWCLAFCFLSVWFIVSHRVKEEEKSDYDIPAWAMKYQICRWDTPIQSWDTVFLYWKEFPANYEDVDTVVIDGLEYDISDF